MAKLPGEWDRAALSTITALIKDTSLSADGIIEAQATRGRLHVDVGFWGVAPAARFGDQWRPRTQRAEHVFCGVERRAHQRAPGHKGRVVQQVDCAGISLWSPRWRASDEARRTIYIPRPRRVLQLDR